MQAAKSAGLAIPDEIAIADLTIPAAKLLGLIPHRASAGIRSGALGGVHTIPAATGAWSFLAEQELNLKS